MKKVILSLILSIIFLETLSVLSFAAGIVEENPKAKIYIDCKEVKFINIPIKVNGEFLVEANDLLSKLGISDSKHINFDENRKSLTIIYGNSKVNMLLNNNKATVGKEVIILNAAPVMYKNKIYIPVKSTAELFKQKFAWDTASNTIFLRNLKDYNHIKDVLDSAVSSFNKIEKLHLDYSDDTKYNYSKNDNVSTRTFYDCEINTMRKIMNINISVDGDATSERFLFNNCLFTKDISNNKWSKKYFASSEFDGYFNNYLVSKHIQSYILYCSLSIKEFPKYDLIKLSGNVYITFEDRSIIPNNATNMNTSISIKRSSKLLTQVARSYDQYRSSKNGKYLFSATKIFSYYESDKYLSIPDEAYMNFDKGTSLEEKNEGIRQYNLGNYDLAIIHYDKAIQLEPLYDLAYNNKGNALSQLGKYEEAMKCYDKAIEISPEFSNAYFNKAIVSEKLNKKEEAIKYYLKVIELNPYNSNALHQAGYLLKQAGRNDEALECYNEYIKIISDDSDAYVRIADILILLKRPEEAIQAYDKALALKPKDANILLNKGYAFSLLGEDDEAIKYYDMALKIDTELSDAYDYKAHSLFRLKRYDEALEYYNNLLDKYPDSAQLYYNKAGVLVALNRIDNAIECLNKAFELDPDFKNLAQDDKAFYPIRESAKFKSIISK
ncbi:MAG: Tetratricopeptide 2 repeat-containing protein [Eubacterium sp.]|nr:Tetratricopeptide 2 repeat-containing protein [Eubacterium sp.]